MHSDVSSCSSLRHSYHGPGRSTLVAAGTAVPPHPLEAFELVQGAIEVPFEVRFVTEQVIELRGERNVLPKRFQLDLL